MMNDEFRTIFLFFHFSIQHSQFRIQNSLLISPTAATPQYSSAKSDNHVDTSHTRYTLPSPSPAPLPAPAPSPPPDTPPYKSGNPPRSSANTNTPAKPPPPYQYNPPASTAAPPSDNCSCKTVRCTSRTTSHPPQ